MHYSARNVTFDMNKYSSANLITNFFEILNVIINMNLFTKL